MTRFFIMTLLGLFVFATTQAATPILQKTKYPTSTLRTKAFPLLRLPSISRLSSGTACVRGNAKISIIGRNFGRSRGTRYVVAKNSSVHRHLSIASAGWSSTSIKVTVPTLKAGTNYQLGIETITHAQQGNTVTLKICSFLAIPGRFPSKLKPGFRRPIKPVDPGPVVVTPADDGGGEGDDWEDDWEDDYTDGGGVPTPRGGTLLGSGLPPPPKAVSGKGKRRTPKKFRGKIEARQIVVVSTSMREAQALARKARALGARPASRRVLSGLGLVITRFKIKQGSSPDILRKLRKKAPKQWMDVNHRFTLQASSSRKVFGAQMIKWRRQSSLCGKNIRIGLIDTGVDKSHPALKHSKIFNRSFTTAGIQRAPLHHGTAVASILVGRDSKNEYPGLLPGATLYAANVFRKRDSRNVDTTAEWIVLGLDWLASQRVRVVNMSLGGPRNLLVEAAIKRLQQRNILVVAAAGNNGPNAVPVYPAAQVGVVAVSAIDARSQTYRSANRGNYISYVAPGVDIWAATPNGKGSYFSGTSYASPYVAALYAFMKQRQPKTSWNRLHKIIRGQARDLGTSGKDPIYGWGLVQNRLSCK